jgi:hypothetical protein
MKQEYKKKAPPGWRKIRPAIKNKRGPRAAFVWKTLCRSERADVGRLQTFGAGFDLEFNALVFGERPEAFALDLAEVGEKIFAPLFRCDETEALGVIEPFDGAGLSAHLRSCKEGGLFD